MSPIMKCLVNEIARDLNALNKMRGGDNEKPFNVNLADFGFAPVATMIVETVGKADYDTKSEVEEFEIEVLRVEDGNVYACSGGWCDDYDGFYTQELLEDLTIESVNSLRKYVDQMVSKQEHDHWNDDGVTFENCPECGNEVVLLAQLAVQTCPICGKRIVACSMCRACTETEDNYCTNCCLCYQAKVENEESGI